MDIGAYGEYTIRVTHGDGTTECRKVRNKLNRRFRQAVLQTLHTSIGSNWNVYAMAFGDTPEPPADTDWQLYGEFWRTTSLAMSPSSVPETGDHITWTMTMLHNEHLSDWPTGTACREAGVFVTMANPDHASERQMLSRVAVVPEVTRYAGDTIQFDFTITMLLNGMTSTDERSNGGFGGGC